MDGFTHSCSDAWAKVRAVRKDGKINSPDIHELRRIVLLHQAPEQGVDNPAESKPKPSLAVRMQHIP